MAGTAPLTKGLDGLGLASLSVLILQVSTQFLPFFVVLQYLTPTRAILAVGLVAAIGKQALARRGNGWRGARQALAQSRLLLVCITLLLLWYAIATGMSGSLTSFSVLRLRLEELLAFGLAILTLDSKSKFRAIGLVVAVAVAAVSLQAIAQFGEGQNTNYFLIWQQGWQTRNAIAMPEGAIPRVVGYFDNPNVLAAYLLLLGPLAAVPVTAASSARWRAPQWALGVLVVLALVALVLTFSRGAILALVVGIGAVWVRTKPLEVGALALLAIALLANPLSLDRLSTGQARLTAWQIALDSIQQNPLFGIGLGNFRERAVNVYGEPFWHAHNLFLNVAAEAGIVASLLLLGVFIAALRQAWMLSRQSGSGAALGRAFAIALVGFGLASLLDNPYNAMPVSYAFWLLLGLLVAARNIWSKRSPPGKLRQHRQASLRRERARSAVRTAAAPNACRSPSLAAPVVIAGVLH